MGAFGGGKRSLDGQFRFSQICQFLAQQKHGYVRVPSSLDMLRITKRKRKTLKVFSLKINSTKMLKQQKQRKTQDMLYFLKNACILLQYMV